MKKILVVFLFVFICVNINAKTTQAENDAVKTMNEQKEAWNRGDLLAYMNGYWNSDSLVFTGKNGPQYGWNTTYDNYKKSFTDKSKMGNLEFTYLTVKQQANDVVSIIGKWELTIAEQKRGGYFTCILKIIDGKWKVIIDHTS